MAKNAQDEEGVGLGVRQEGSSKGEGQGQGRNGMCTSDDGVLRRRVVESTRGQRIRWVGWSDAAKSSVKWRCFQWC